MNRKELMRNLQMIGLVLQDVNLYLDTHPTDKAALNYFNKYSILYAKYRNEYEMNYGPLTVEGTRDTIAWTWIDEPWPWQMEV